MQSRDESLKVGWHSAIFIKNYLINIKLNTLRGNEDEEVPNEMN